MHYPRSWGIAANDGQSPSPCGTYSLDSREKKIHKARKICQIQINAIEKLSGVKSEAVLPTMDFLLSFQIKDRTATHPHLPLTEVAYGNVTCFGQVNIVDVTSRQILESQ